MKTQTTIWYFADPMCSWCWGFSPVLDRIKLEYGEDLKIALMLGGLRPGTTEPMTPELREEILHHWQAVQKLTNQEFTFEGALPEGFIYDTERPSRAVIAISEINPEFTLPFFRLLQRSFYVGQKDITDMDVLSDLVMEFTQDIDDFTKRFNSDEVKKKTQLHFQHTRQTGVRGFPAIVIQTEKDFNMIASGYRPFDDINHDIRRWLEEH